MTHVFRIGRLGGSTRTGGLGTASGAAGAPGKTGRRLRRRVLAATAALALLSGAAACSDKSGGGGAGGKVILRATGAPTGPMVKNFNPYAITGPMNLMGGVGMINEPLFIPNVLKVGDFKPWLAKSWQFSPDGKQLTLDLQTGVKWTDGQAFTADDVAFSINLLLKNPALNQYGLLASSARAEGPAKAVIDFPAPAFTQLPFVGLTAIVPKHIWELVQDPNTYTFENPVGTGPFKLESWTPQGYLLAKNPGYWQAGKPKIDGIRYVAYTSNVSANLALAQGELDWAGNFVNNIDKEYVAKDPANNHYWFPPMAPMSLGFNLTKPQWQNADVRKAVSFALDRKALAQLAFQGEEQPNMTPTGLLPQHAEFIADKYKSIQLTQDIPQAKALLAKAGYKPGGDGIMVGPDGKRLTMTLLTSSSFTDVLTLYQVMTDQLKQVGIEVKIDSKSTTESITDTYMGNFDVGITGPAYAAYSPFNVYERTLAGYLTAPVGQPAFNNTERWQDPETDKLLQQYASTQDPAVQKQALEGLQDIMVEKMPIIPLYNFAAWSEYSTKSVVGWPDKDNPYIVGISVGAASVYVATMLEPKK
ncbi:ABC transporter substrate-binding protein [Yinghuangia aomiensis]|uniref:ABC transporter substrate-binding protein n=1 Tax=Yinghuangia aomiensis TaxID=676205 RepID=A0ABP9I7X2_9ACTN